MGLAHDQHPTFPSRGTAATTKSIADIFAVPLRHRVSAVKIPFENFAHFAVNSFNIAGFTAKYAKSTKDGFDRGGAETQRTHEEGWVYVARVTHNTVPAAIDWLG